MLPLRVTKKRLGTFVRSIKTERNESSRKDRGSRSWDGEKKYLPCRGEVIILTKRLGKVRGSLLDNWGEKRMLPIPSRTTEEEATSGSNGGLRKTRPQRPEG